MSGQGFRPKTANRLLMIGQGYAGKAALERRTISVHDSRGRAVASCSRQFHPGKFADYCAIPLISRAG
jgi:hypothetical protein